MVAQAPPAVQSIVETLNKEFATVLTVAREKGGSGNNSKQLIETVKTLNAELLQEQVCTALRVLMATIEHPQWHLLRRLRTRD